MSAADERDKLALIPLVNDNGFHKHRAYEDRE
jgi:hypothetical protein